jgi:Tfp pilus assembly protein PilX
MRTVALPARQRGVTLFVALVVLVALTLTGLAMMRSVDTSTIVAGNIGFRESAVNAADQGVQSAYAYVLNNLAGLGSNSGNDPANGYSGVVPPGERPDWYLDPTNASWQNAVSCNGATGTASACTSFAPSGTSKDPAGNNVTYVIHRLCDSAGVCGQTQSSAAISGEGVDQSAPNFFGSPPATHFRVTVRAAGPRNSIAFVQSMMRAR